MLAGVLGGGERLPSSRELAKDLGISRTLVLEAFEQLEAEGYIEGRKGAGSFVVEGASPGSEGLSPGPRNASGVDPSGHPRPSPQAQGQGQAQAQAQGQRPGAPAVSSSPGSLPPVDFKPGVPALDLFPREAWARELAAAVRRLPTGAIGYGDGAGLPALREETAAYLFRSRGIRADPEDIFITSGISQALGIVSRAFLARGAEPRDETAGPEAASSRGVEPCPRASSAAPPSRPDSRKGGAGHRLDRPRDLAVLENPCQPALSGLLVREGIPIFPAAVDAGGLDPSSLPRDRSAVAFVTPSHQYPLGPVLSAPRRVALVEWARATDSILMEDDFDGEYRYGGAPLQPLRELDPGRVVYAGSFSKVFAPGLRLGYAIVPPHLADAWRSCRELMDIHSCVFTQAAVASYLASGAFERHVRRMKRVYAARRAALLGELAGAFGDGVEVVGEAAGLHLALRFKPRDFPGLRFDGETVSRIARSGAVAYPASRYAFAPAPGIEGIILLGYGNLDEASIARGVGALASALGTG